VRFILTGGNASGARSAIPLLDGLDADHVIADKAMMPTLSSRRAGLKALREGGMEDVFGQRKVIIRRNDDLAGIPPDWRLRLAIRHQSLPSADGQFRGQKFIEQCTLLRMFWKPSSWPPAFHRSSIKKPDR
jgi:hypothetical protein